MNTKQPFPSFDTRLSDLDQFIWQLVDGYRAGKIKSWDDLEERVKVHFTPERMEQIESVTPGWRKMASYADGVTLVHVMCVFLGLFMMPEFLAMTSEQKQLMKWIILLHDVEKEPQPGRRDHMHAFRSAVTAARILPKLGFPATAHYDSLIDSWEELSRSATIKPEHSPSYMQDNRKLPEILEGIDQLFGRGTSAALIIKTILFHLSIDMEPWPPLTPLTEEEVKRYIDSDLVFLLEAMNLGDSEGWSMFQPERKELGNEVRKAFQKVRRLVST